MPFLDGTGPLGEGPMTGRGLGRCKGAFGRAPLAFRGFGFGRGLGFGRGFGWRFFPYGISREEEKRILEEEKRIIEERLKALGNTANEEKQ